MKFHVGMATYDDWDGVYFTVTSLLTHHRDRVAEITVVDNAPEIEHVASKLREWCGRSGVRYIPLHTPKGTASRDLVFRVSKLPTVCVDSHVLLAPGSFDALASAWKGEPAIYHGPLINDNGTIHATNLKREWGDDGMLGKWSSELKDHTEPVEMGAHGCGLMACDPKHWPGFNPLFRGFGGEEWYIQDKMRQRGGKVWYVPGLKWTHRWWCIRPGVVPYGPRLWDKARNQWLAHKELGYDPATVKSHFPQITKDQWSQIENGAEAPIMACGSCKTVGSVHKTPQAWHVANKTDDRFLVCIGRTVDAGKKFDVSVPGILASGVTDLTVLHPEAPAAGSRFGAKWIKGDSITTDPVPCDTLVLGDHGSSITMMAEVERWHGVVKKRMLVPIDPQRLPVLMRFLRDHREWSVYKHAVGWMCVTKDKADKIKPPRLVSLKTVSTFAKALKSHLADGGKKVDEKEYERRLTACDGCPARNNTRCGHCGCALDAKAAWASEHCPIGEW